MHAVLSCGCGCAALWLRCAALRCTLRRCTTLHGCVPAVRQLPIRSCARADGGALERQAAVRGCAARRPVAALCRECTEDARGTPSTPGPIRYLQCRLLCGGNGALAAGVPGRWVPVLGVCRGARPCAVPMHARAHTVWRRLRRRLYDDLRQRGRGRAVQRQVAVACVVCCMLPPHLSQATAATHSTRARSRIVERVAGTKTRL